MTGLIDIIAGARPNFIKIAAIIAEMDRVRSEEQTISYRLVHTGQHYDEKMSGAFFTQLGIPTPDINLEVGSGTQAEQTAAIMVGYERLLLDAPCRLCLVVGDVTSTMACTVVARKLGIPVAHVEAGIRSGDWSMPEEINRVVTDSISNWFFTTSRLAGENLVRSGIREDQIFFVGNTMIDTLLRNIPRLTPPPLWVEAGLKPREYFVLTLHRPANVDDHQALAAMMEAIARGTRGLPVVFPVHPRTRKNLPDMLKAKTNTFHLAEPLGYLEFNYLVKHAKAIITDSGGITEEATAMGVPCMTLRDNTERPETVTHGTNEMIGTDPDNLGPVLDRLFAGDWKQGRIPERWDGQAARRIVSTLIALGSRTMADHE